MFVRVNLLGSRDIDSGISIGDWGLYVLVHVMYDIGQRQILNKIQNPNCYVVILDHDKYLCAPQYV